MLPALEAAVGWLTGPADADGDGFLEYVDRSGHGLANQGWKDSGDSVRFRDGSLAAGPIALVEVQGYAYEAAGLRGRAADAPSADRAPTGCWRGGRPSAERFRQQRSGSRTTAGAYPAMALDGTKRPVDSVTSNIGHLLGTGILSGRRGGRRSPRGWRSDDMDCGYGLRTMSSADGGFSPLSYHCGSVWPHDTAIVAVRSRPRGADRARRVAGRGPAAWPVSRFDGRLPELWAGDQADGRARSGPYPAACRPQAWSAAAAVSVLRDLARPVRRRARRPA